MLIIIFKIYFKRLLIKKCFKIFSGSKVGKYNNVTVSDCEPDAATCILKRGTDASITISFDVGKLKKKYNFLKTPSAVV